MENEYKEWLTLCDQQIKFIKHILLRLEENDNRDDTDEQQEDNDISIEDYPYPDIGILYATKREDTRNEMMQVLATRKELDDKSILFFTTDNIDIEHELIRGYLVTEYNHLTEAVTHLPKVIYNVALHSKPTSVKKIRNLRTSETINIINPINWFRQDILFDMLASFTGEEHLLAYQQFTESALSTFLKKYEKCYIVPRRDYKHLKVITITQIDSEYVKVIIGKDEQYLNIKELYSYLEKITQGKYYNIYQAIDTVTINQLPAELRVYLQKDETANWTVTSKLVKNEAFASGSIYRNKINDVKDAFIDMDNEIYTKVLDQIEHVPKDFATYLDYFIPHVGSYTFDFIISKEGSIHLFYISGCEQFEYLKRYKNTDWIQYLNRIFDFINYHQRRGLKDELLD